MNLAPASPSSSSCASSVTDHRRRSVFGARFVDNASREFAALPRRVRRQITARLRLLALAPREGEDVMFMWGEWEGFWRLVVGEYRVIYDILDRAQEIQVVRVRHRSDAYDDRR